MFILGGIFCEGLAELGIAEEDRGEMQQLMLKLAHEGENGVGRYQRECMGMNRAIEYFDFERLLLAHGLDHCVDAFGEESLTCLDDCVRLVKNDAHMFRLGIDVQDWPVIRQMLGVNDDMLVSGLISTYCKLCATCLHCLNICLAPTHHLQINDSR